MEPHVVSQPDRYFARSGVVACDARGAVVWLDADALSILGVPADRAQGRPLDRLLADLSPANEPLAASALAPDWASGAPCHACGLLVGGDGRGHEVEVKVVPGHVSGAGPVVVCQ